MSLEAAAAEDDAVELTAVFAGAPAATGGALETEDVEANGGSDVKDSPAFASAFDGSASTGWKIVPFELKDETLPIIILLPPERASNRAFSLSLIGRLSELFSKICGIFRENRRHSRVPAVTATLTGQAFVSDIARESCS